MYRVLKPITHGIGNQEFKLKPGEIVPDDFFREEVQIVRHLELGNIEATREVEETPLEPEKSTVDIKNLSEMTIPDAREFLEDVPDVVSLERYLDQENVRGQEARKSVTNFISRRIANLTGYE